MCSSHRSWAPSSMATCPCILRHPSQVVDCNMSEFGCEKIEETDSRLSLDCCSFLLIAVVRRFLTFVREFQHISMSTDIEVPKFSDGTTARCHLRVPFALVARLALIRVGFLIHPWAANLPTGTLAHWPLFPCFSLLCGHRAGETAENKRHISSYVSSKHLKSNTVDDILNSVSLILAGIYNRKESWIQMVNNQYALQQLCSSHDVFVHKHV